MGKYHRSNFVNYCFHNYNSLNYASTCTPGVDSEFQVTAVLSSFCDPFYDVSLQDVFHYWCAIFVWKIRICIRYSVCTSIIYLWSSAGHSASCSSMKNNSRAYTDRSLGRTGTTHTSQSGTVMPFNLSD